MPAGWRAPHLIDNCFGVSTGKVCPHPGQRNAIEPTEVNKYPASNPAWSFSENPCHRQIDETDVVVRSQEHIATVHVGKRNTSRVEIGHNALQTIEDPIFDHFAMQLCQRVRLHPSRCQSPWTELPEEVWQSIDPRSGGVCRGFAADQPTAQQLSDQPGAIFIGFECYRLPSDSIEENVGFGGVAASDFMFRTNIGQQVERKSKVTARRVDRHDHDLISHPKSRC